MGFFYSYVRGNMVIFRVALLLLSGLSLCSCGTSYNFTVSAYPSNIAPYEAGWTYLAKVLVQDRSGVPPSEPTLKKCLIEVTDQSKAKLLSEVVQVRGGQLTPKMEWQEGPALLVSIYDSSPEASAPLYQALYQLNGGKFQKVPSFRP